MGFSRKFAMNKLEDIKCPSVLNPIYSDRQTFKSSLISIAKERLAKIRTQEICKKKTGIFTDLSKSIPADVIQLENPRTDAISKESPESLSIISHLEQSKFQIKKAYYKAIVDWISQCLHEGHIEPSQPCVERLVGWPIRSFRKSSILTDFRIYCMKNGLPENDSVRDNSFTAILDAVFDAKENRYSFPSLEECRHRFQKISIEET